MSFSPRRWPLDAAEERSSSSPSFQFGSTIDNQSYELPSGFARISQAIPRNRRSKSCPDCSKLGWPLKAPVAEQELLLKFNEVLGTHLGHIIHVIRKENEKNLAKIEASIRELEHGMSKKFHTGVDSHLSLPRGSALSSLGRHSAVSSLDPGSRESTLRPCADQLRVHRHITPSSSAQTADPSTLDVAKRSRQVMKCSSEKSSRSIWNSTGDPELLGSAQPKQGLGSEGVFRKKQRKQPRKKRHSLFSTTSSSSVPGLVERAIMVEMLNTKQKVDPGSDRNSHDTNPEKPRASCRSSTSSASCRSRSSQAQSRQSSPSHHDEANDDNRETLGASEASEDEMGAPPSFQSKLGSEKAVIPGSTYASSRGGTYGSGSLRGSLEVLRQRKDTALAMTGLTSYEDKKMSYSATLSQAWEESTNGKSLFSSDTDAYEDLWSEAPSFESRLQCLPWIIFRLCGIIPWHRGNALSNVYSLMSLLLAIAVAAYPALRIAQGKVDSTHMCILPFTVAGVLGGLSLRRSFTMQLFAQFPGPLEHYSMKHGFSTEFLRRSLSHFTLMLILWACAALVQGVGEVLTLDGISCSTDNDPWVFVCFLIGSILFVALLYCQLHVICVLSLMVDRYCIKLFPYPTSSNDVLDWNLIQAMLRQIAGAFDFCFMITQTGAYASVLLVGVQILFLERVDEERMDRDGKCDESSLIPFLLPPVLLALGAFVVFFKAAFVSEKCSRVAPLVNSLTFDDQDDALDSKRMNTVHFISSSGAGFYIQEVRITASMAMKLMYVTGLGAFALVTKLVTDTGGKSV